MASFTAEYWYRAADGPDRSVRSSSQMLAPVRGVAQVRQITRNLVAQGYEVQRVLLRTVCIVCDGNGRIAVAPKGTRKAAAAKLPAWRLTWRECAICHGHGHTSTREVTNA